MKKQHIILVPVVIMVYVIYLIVDYKYNEYKINSYIENIQNLNDNLRNKIENTRELIEYKSSQAYINKILKTEQSLKNKGEVVMHVTTQQRYEKFTSDEPIIETEVVVEAPQINITQNMTIKQRWMYFLFKKDTR